MAINLPNVLLKIVISSILIALLAMSVTLRIEKDVKVQEKIEEQNVAIATQKFSKQLYRGEHIGMADTRDDDVLVPYGMYADGGLKPNCIKDPVKHVLGNNFSYYLSTTLDFYKAFGWATEAEGITRKTDGIVWIINSNSIPMSRIWSTITMMGDPFREREILIKGIVRNAIPFPVFHYESPRQAYARAISQGLIH